MENTMPVFSLNIRKYGLITGGSLILMAIVAGFVYGYVHETIYVPGDALQTSKLLEDNLPLFAAGIAAWGLIIILDIMVAVGIYGLYKDPQKTLAALTSGSRIIYVLFLCYALLQLAMPLINQAEIENSLVHYEAFETIWSYGLMIFGAHLLLFAVLCFKSKFTPDLLSFLLFIGGLGYIVIDGSKSFFQHINVLIPVIENGLTVIMAVSELAFAVWILAKSIRSHKAETN